VGQGRAVGIVLGPGTSGTVGRVLSLAWVIELDPGPLSDAVVDLRARLASSGMRDAGDVGSTADARAADAVLVWADRPLRADLAEALAAPGVRTVLVGPTLAAQADGPLPVAAGVRADGATPVHDVRIRPTGPGAAGVPGAPHQHGDHAHRDAHEHVTDRVVLVSGVEPDVQVLRTANVGLAVHPLMTWRPAEGMATWTIGGTPGAVRDRGFQRALLQLVRMVGGVPVADPVRVGLLGYGAIGHEHSRAVRAVDGLALAAVCDTSQERLERARVAAPGIATTTSAEELLERDDVDLVVVSTPPSTHAAWAMAALAADKHLVVEKPFAIRTDEADAVLAAARAADRLAVVYQNRRFDPDHLALRRAVRAGALGQVFRLEAFVGGYGHPCNLWHSDEGVSGGAFYDWGSHVIDQILDLVVAPVEHVTASAHKLRWFDVTNADHSRVGIRFADGTEAEFVHSDLAAALKPRWYVLGTEGAVVGRWRTERVVSRNDIGTLVEDVLAPADSPPRMELHAGDGSVTHLATPPAEPYTFHRELADHLRWGLSMTVTGEQSRRVLAVMEAARESAADAGRPVVPR
jgi:predicted dehydrogenase